jgi:outer membrane protein TolC
MLLLIAVVPAGSATVVDHRVSEPVSSPDLRLSEGNLILTLDEAISIALDSNLTLVVQRFAREESELSLWGRKGIYDYNVGVDVGAFSETSPTASNLDAGAGQTVQEQDGERWNFSAGRLFSSGGQGSINWNNRRFESNSIFATLNPSYRVDFDLTFNQPLMRGFGRDVTEHQIRIARTNVDISQENFELRVTETLQAVENAYWSLAEAKAQLLVAEESLALAKQLHEQNRIRVDVGTLAPLELVQSEAGVATRQEGIIRARAAVGDGEDLLRQLLNLESGALWDAPIILETEADIDPIAIDLEEGITSAMATRPELRSKRLGQDILDYGVQYSINQEKPRVDLSVVYGLNGLGGDITERDFFTGDVLFEAPGSYSDALDQITDGNFDGWSVGVNMAYPIRNRTAKAARALAEVNFERGAAELRDLELGVATEVRRVARVVEAAAEARKSARVSRVLEERNLDAEHKRYENGMSTSFQVLQIQEDLSEARSREVTAVATYRRALVQYYRSIGRLPAERGVEFAATSE